MQEIDELSTVNCINASEPTPREYAELEELSDGTILKHLWNHKRPS